MKKRNYLLDSEDRGGGNGFSVIADFDGSEEQLMDIEVGDTLPVLPLRSRERLRCSSRRNGAMSQPERLNSRGASPCSSSRQASRKCSKVTS